MFRIQFQGNSKKNYAQYCTQFYVQYFMHKNVHPNLCIILENWKVINA